MRDIERRMKPRRARSTQRFGFGLVRPGPQIGISCLRADQSSNHLDRRELPTPKPLCSLRPSRCHFALGVTLVALLLLPSPAVADEPVDLSGTWKVDYLTTAQTKIPVVGDFHTTTRVVLAAEIEQEGTDLTILTRVCSLELSSDMPLAQPVAPPAFAESLPEVERRGELIERDDHWELRIYPTWETVGVRLDDPAQDELPDDGDDPRVFDQDGDGNPGATILVEGIIDAEIYILQKSWDSWRGRVRNENTIEGGLRWHTEQSVVGASHRILRRQPRATPHPDQAKNLFRMTRVRNSPPC